MTLALRPATAADDAFLTRASYAFERDEGHPPGEDPGPPFIASTRRFFDENPSRGAVLVIDRAGEAIGYVILVALWSNEFRGETFLLDELYVDPAHRGGAGREALDAVLDYARARGAGQVSLEVLDANPRVAGLYARRGFVSERRSYWRKL
ncbi:MAG: GNAT family N-acetyltransferase [Myxococcales bacterium]|nr:GNAT family N-acetyltransferase [Myxococcales bacterium]